MQIMKTLPILMLTVPVMTLVLSCGARTPAADYVHHVQNVIGIFEDADIPDGEKGAKVAAYVESHGAEIDKTLAALASMSSDEVGPHVATVRSAVNRIIEVVSARENDEYVLAALLRLRIVEE